MPTQTETAAVAAVLATTERRYVEALNAVLAARGGSPDVDRWRGMAEAYRQTAESLRTTCWLGEVNYRSEEWRDAHGVYTRHEVAEMHR